MFKKIIKLFMPSEKTLAKTAADAIAKAVNESGKAEIMAKYANLADNAVKMQAYVTEMLKDGKIDEVEKGDIADKLAPLMKTIVDMI